MSAADDADGGLPTTVLTFGGSGRTYHRPERTDSGVSPACSTTAEDPYLKRREVVEPHYRPCKRCFPER